MTLTEKSNSVLPLTWIAFSIHRFYEIIEMVLWSLGLNLTLFNLSKYKVIKVFLCLLVVYMQLNVSVSEVPP